MPIELVLFDLGDTLIHAKDPWPPIYAHADRELIKVLNHAGIPVNRTTFYDGLGSFIETYFASLRQDNIEPTSFNTLRDLLARKGYRNVPEAVLAAALDALYAVTQSNLYAEDDAIPTLENLKSAGYRLGMISNTSDDKNVQQKIDQWGLRPYFEKILTSAALGIRKPDRRIFQVMLDHFGVPPQRTAMIGDTLQADILGANQMGIYSIWITRRVETGPDPTIRARKVVDSLAQIPTLLRSIP